MNPSEATLYSIIVVCVTVLIFSTVASYFEIKKLGIEKVLGPVDEFKAKLRELSIQQDRLHSWVSSSDERITMAYEQIEYLKNAKKENS